MKKTDRLYYHNTETEVLEGDHIAFKSLFFGKTKLGRVSYIPAKTAIELSNENKNPDDWLIELSDKTATGWLYHPEDMQPTKRIQFLSRTSDSYKGLTSAESEELESRLEENESLWEKAILGLLLLAIILVLLLLVRSCTT